MFSTKIAVERSPYYPTKKIFNDLVTELSLTKTNTELLSARVKQWDLLDNSVRITS